MFQRFAASRPLFAAGTSALLIALIAVATWWGMQSTSELRRELLAEQIRRQAELATDDSVDRWVRELAALEDAAVVPLVELAVGPRQRTALAAQRTIVEMLASWRAELEQSQRALGIDDDLAKLTEALAQRLDGLGPAGASFASRVAWEVLDLGSRMRSVDVQARVRAIRHCETILDHVVSARGDSPTARENFVQSPSGLGPLAAQAERVADLWPDSLQVRDVAGGGLGVPPPVGPTDVDNMVRPGPNLDATSIAPREPAPLPPGMTSQRLDESLPDWRPDWQLPADEDDERVPASESPRPQRLPAPSELSLAPSDAAQRESPQPPPAVAPPVVSDDARDQLKRQLRTLPTLELMRMSTSSRAVIVAATMAELRRRRFTEVELERARRYAGSDVAQRILMVEEVSARPRKERRAWLRWLSEDSAADVRIAVLQAMSATEDAAFNYRIREMAIHERDERVARVAHGLLEQQRNVPR